MVSLWAQKEMATAELEDQRLNERLTRIVSDLGDRSTVSIPAACGGHAEMTAAYRFFDNDKVTWEKILEPHYERTRERIAEQAVVLMVQDTSEINVTRPQQQVVGAGPLDGPERRGAFLHTLQAFTPDGTPLGAVSEQVKLSFFSKKKRSKPQKMPSLTKTKTRALVQIGAVLCS